jgi:hypothetical protein
VPSFLRAFPFKLTFPIPFLFPLSSFLYPLSSFLSSTTLIQTLSPWKRMGNESPYSIGSTFRKFADRKAIQPWGLQTLMYLYGNKSTEEGQFEIPQQSGRSHRNMSLRPEIKRQAACPQRTIQAMHNHFHLSSYQ